MDIEGSLWLFPFKRTSFDWLIAIFLVTAWVGYWAAYDRTTAWSKFGLIILAALLYYAISAQPKENLVWISAIFFGLGVGVALYFFLTHDFVTAPRKLEFVNSIGRWVMGIRPQVQWMSIHPNYIAGIVAITTPFIVYPVWMLRNTISWVVLLFYSLVLVGLGVAFVAILMATSRGVILAIVSAAGVWILWKIVNLNRIKLRFRHEAIFPSLVMIYLFSIITFLYMGPADSGNIFSSQYYYGSGSRAELADAKPLFPCRFSFHRRRAGGVPWFICSLYVRHTIFQCYK